MREPVRAVALCLILAACSSDSRPGVAAGPAAQDFFPLVKGAHWVYRVDFGGLRRGEVEVIGQGPRRVPGFEGDVFITDEVIDGKALGFGDVAPVGYVTVEGYLGQVSGLDYDPKGEVVVLGGEDPKRFLPVEPKPGATWEEGASRMFQLPEGGGGVSRWSRRIELRESLEVPAGTFRDVVLVESRYWDNGAEEKPLMRYEDFYARGVGLLRSVTYNEQEGGRQIVEQSLLRYTFPDGSSGAATP